MTATRNLAIMAALISLFAFNMSAFAAKVDCCIGHSSRPVPVGAITGYVHQESNEMCDIDAIIFYTVKRREICANPNAGWVKRNLKNLSKRLEQMSQKY
uniref:Macrophage inflammatory protein-3 alpha n=1 Tax=Callorhinchus milii TaxID=7868 RepID=V9LFA9_CALMI|eukprot:gi/632934574/ref/XP_007885553.1/ PREDICTED: C-C motif chemokine 20-like [Callorhinchus milii]